jgi:hypothetical protein
MGTIIRNNPNIPKAESFDSNEEESKDEIVTEFLQKSKINWIDVHIN